MSKLFESETRESAERFGGSPTESFPVEVSSTGAEVDGERLLLSVIRDCSVRYESQARLQESEQLLERAGRVIAPSPRAFTSSARSSATASPSQ